MALNNIYSTKNAAGEDTLKIEGGVNIEDFVSILAKKHITISHDTHIGPGACIVDFDHYIGPDFTKTGEDGEMGEIYIGAHCWIGANAVVLKGVTLGDGCVVGAGAVVTHSFPAGSIIVGNPGRLLRKR